MAKRWTPSFDYTFPPEERAEKEHVWRLIFLLRYHLANFGHVLSLFDHCEELLAPQPKDLHELVATDAHRARVANWKRVAARDAVMTVYHFGVTLDGLKRGVGRAASLRIVDSKKLKGAWKRFLERFPDYERLRHAVAHLADDMSTHEKLAALKPEQGDLARGQLRGRRYVFFVSKGEMTLSVSRETLTELDAIMTEAWSAFQTIDKVEQEAVLRRLRDRSARQLQVEGQSRKDQGER